MTRKVQGAVGKVELNLRGEIMVVIINPRHSACLMLTHCHEVNGMS